MSENDLIPIATVQTSTPELVNLKPVTPLTKIPLDYYFVVVGFEVNNPEAFVNGIHILNKDYGHAFFYLVKNGYVQNVMSFGPAGPLGKQGWFNEPTITAGAAVKDGYASSRPGTPDFGISEVSKLFRIPITKEQFKILNEETTKVRSQILKGQQNYTAWVNDTCAETARDILKIGIPDIPDGQGWVNVSEYVHDAWAVNPYKWHHNFIMEGKYPEIVFLLPDGKSWVPTIMYSEPDLSSPSSPDLSSPSSDRPSYINNLREYSYDTE